MDKLNWTPWMGMSEMREKMDKLLDEAMTGSDAARRLREKGRIWVPAADVLETGEAFVIRVELPGIDPRDVRVEVKDSDLWIYGERPFAPEGGQDPEKSVYQVLERSYGPFARKFVLSRRADRNDIRASFSNGLLTVTVTKLGRKPSRKRIVIESD